MSDLIRSTFTDKLSGHGLELGALHRPMPTHTDMHVKYVDRLTVQEMAQHYPELKEKGFIKPHIIDDAETLATVADNTQDFVIAAHVIEHMRNPIGAVGNWLRVLKQGGLLYLVVPNYRKIFDKDRERTTIAHLMEDFRAPSRDRDHDHYLEYAEKVDGKKGEEILDHALKLIAMDYSVHYHCFTPDDIFSLLFIVHNELVSMKIMDWLALEDDSEFHFLVRKESI